jgi:bifunctional DNA-binding transcriptional regulator/antitoxin component of YhaV-PrlF toxin-antitoxin module
MTAPNDEAAATESRRHSSREQTMDAASTVAMIVLPIASFIGYRALQDRSPPSSPSTGSAAPAGAAAHGLRTAARAGRGRLRAVPAVRGSGRLDLYHAHGKVKEMAKVSSKNQITLPVEAMRAAGLRPGEEVTVRPIGDGELIIAARGSRVRRHAGIATGIYEQGELDRLRDEWER